MKKILTLLLTVIMSVACCLGLTACGDKEIKTVEVPSIAQNYLADILGSVESYGGIPEDYKIGFIFLHDEKSTYDLNFYEAAKKAVLTMGLSSDQVIYKFNVPEGQECYDAAKELVEGGCKAVFANSFGHEDFMIKAAKDFTDVDFYHATGTKAHTEELDNYHNGFASIYEGRYLAGIAAGMKLNEMIKNGTKVAGKVVTAENAKIGYVGAFTYAEVISGYTSFFLGARSVCPTVTMEVQFTGSWYDEVAEKSAAEALISRGCNLISQHADSMGAPSACERKKVPNVSYNGSTINDCPNTFIVSSRIDWTFYFQCIIADAVMPYDVVDADTTLSMMDGGVVLTALNANAMAEGTVEAIYKAQVELAKGERFVFDCSTFTVASDYKNATVDADGHITQYKADVDTDANFEADTDVVKSRTIGEGENEKTIKYFAESEFRSAPYFDIQINGITLLNSAF